MRYGCNSEVVFMTEVRFDNFTMSKHKTVLLLNLVGCNDLSK